VSEQQPNENLLKVGTEEARIENSQNYKCCTTNCKVVSIQQINRNLLIGSIVEAKIENSNKIDKILDIALLIVKTTYQQKSTEMLA